MIGQKEKELKQLQAVRKSDGEICPGKETKGLLKLSKVFSELASSDGEVCTGKETKTEEEPDGKACSKKRAKGKASQRKGYG